MYSTSKRYSYSINSLTTAEGVICVHLKSVKTSLEKVSHWKIQGWGCANVGIGTEVSQGKIVFVHRSESNLSYEYFGGV